MFLEYLFIKVTSDRWLHRHIKSTNDYNSTRYMYNMFIYNLYYILIYLNNNLKND